MSNFFKSKPNQEESPKETPMQKYLKLIEDIKKLNVEIAQLKDMIQEDTGDTNYLIQELKVKTKQLKTAMDEQEKITMNLDKNYSKPISEMDRYSLKTKKTELEEMKDEINNKLEMSQSLMLNLTNIIKNKNVLNVYLDKIYHILRDKKSEGLNKLEYKVLQDIIEKRKHPFDKIYNNKTTIGYRFNDAKFIKDLIIKFYELKEDSNMFFIGGETGETYQQIVKITMENQYNLNCLVTYPLEHANLVSELKTIEDQITEINKLIPHKSMKGGKITKRKKTTNTTIQNTRKK